VATWFRKGPVIVGMAMGGLVWGLGTGLLPAGIEEIVVYLNLPAMIVGMLVSGNPHVPNTAAFVVAAIAQWAVIASLCGAWVRSRPSTEGYRSSKQGGPDA
jgi:predicted permease